MKCVLLSAVLLGSAAFAAQVSNDANPLYRPVTIRTGTISVPAIPGVPFSAKAIIVRQIPMPDGTVAESRNLNIIARDSRGRTHGEMRGWLPASNSGTPVLSEVIIDDPQTQVRTVCNMVTHVAMRQPQQMPTARVMPPAGPSVKAEDLGTEELEHMLARGTRRSVTIPANSSGTGVPITVVDEYWYSEDLHLNILLVHDDPRTGHQTVALSDLKLGEPDAALFEIPVDFKVVDLTPPPPPKAVRR